MATSASNKLEVSALDFDDIKSNFNKSANAADLLFISRSCYGGIIRFRKLDGYLSTPCGVHKPIKPEKFSLRANLWSEKISNVEFKVMDFSEAISNAKKVAMSLSDQFCHPPYNRFCRSIRIWTMAKKQINIIYL